MRHLPGNEVLCRYLLSWKASTKEKTVTSLHAWLLHQEDAKSCPDQTEAAQGSRGGGLGFMGGACSNIDMVGSRLVQLDSKIIPA